MCRWQAKRLDDVDYRLPDAVLENRVAVQGNDRRLPPVVASPGNAERHRGAAKPPFPGPGGGNSELINPRCAE